MGGWGQTRLGNFIQGVSVDNKGGVTGIDCIFGRLKVRRANKWVETILRCGPVSLQGRGGGGGGLSPHEVFLWYYCTDEREKATLNAAS